MKRSAILVAAGLLALATTATAAQTPAAQDPAAAPPAAAAPASPEALAKGGELFNTRCKVCHADGGAAPGPAELATHKPEQIFDVLKNGAMAPMAAGLSDDDLKAIASFLTTPKPAA